MQFIGGIPQKSQKLVSHVQLYTYTHYYIIIILNCLLPMHNDDNVCLIFFFSFTYSIHFLVCTASFPLLIASTKSLGSGVTCEMMQQCLLGLDLGELDLLQAKI